MLRLFKSKKNKNLLHNNDIVGCIGKLPLQAEFIKCNVVSNQFANLDHWLQQAYAHINRGGDASKQKNLFSHMPLYHFVSCTSAQYNPIIGTFIASQDCSGRPYPFLLFRMLENPIAKEFQTTIPILYSDFFRASESLCRSNWGNMNLSDLQQKINALSDFSIPAVRRLALETVVDKLNQVTVGDFKEGLRNQDPNFELDQLLQSALSALNTSKTQLGEIPPQGLRFPIPESSEQMVYVVFWLQLIESILNLKDSRLQLFWNHSGEHHHASFTLYFNPIPTSYSPHFIDQTRQHENLIDITQAIEASTVQINTKIRQSVQEDQLPLIKLVQRCGGSVFL